MADKLYSITFFSKFILFIYNSENVIKNVISQSFNQPQANGLGWNQNFLRETFRSIVDNFYLPKIDSVKSCTLMHHLFASHSSFSTIFFFARLVGSRIWVLLCNLRRQSQKLRENFLYRLTVLSIGMKPKWAYRMVQYRPNRTKMKSVAQLWANILQVLWNVFVGNLRGT